MIVKLDDIFHPAVNNFWIKGLINNIGNPAGVSLQRGTLAIFSGNQNNWNLLKPTAISQLAQHLKAIHFRHHQV